MGCEGGGSKARTCMGIVDEAARLERAGKPVIHLEKGEVDIDTADVVKEATIAALRANHTRYSISNGLPELRAAICAYYERFYGVSVDPKRVVVNSGSSPAMLELFLALLEPGDEVVIPTPSYPAYPSFVEAARGRVVWASSEPYGFSYTADVARPFVSDATKALYLNFPSNPVGALASLDDLRAFAELGPTVVSDEVYHGLTFGDERPHSILEVTDDAVVVGSFSKSFAMTGWRLGYLVVPEWLVDKIVRMQQNLFVGTNTFVQWGAIAALENAETIQREIRDELMQRRDCMLRALARIGLEVPCAPRGGFYVFARQPEGTGSSAKFAADLLDETFVAITPGTEFGPAGEGYLRFSLSATGPEIDEAMERIEAFLARSRAGGTHDARAAVGAGIE